MTRAYSLLLAATIVAAAGGPILANTITVNSNEDTMVPGDGKCTLREALMNANLDGETTGGDCAFGLGPDRIVFSIGMGPATIQPTSTLGVGPGVTIDATTQPGFAGSPIIELDGSTAAGGSAGLVLFGANSSVRGLVINRFPTNGIYLLNAAQCRIVGNYIGTDLTGTVALANNFNGIFVESSTFCTIGGFLAADRNIISGNNSVGVVFITNSNNNVVSGNYIGVDASGATGLPNGSIVGGVGIIIQSGNGNMIGGATPGAGNVIAGHETGLYIIGPGSATTIQGNMIGTNAAGTAAIANASGIKFMDGGAFSLIGGSVPSARNVISGNMFEGIRLEGPSCHDMLIRGNRIGTDVTGEAPLGNSVGIVVLATAGGAPFNNTIGGAGPGEGNIIARNFVDVVVLSGASHATGIRLQRNSIFGPGAVPAFGFDLAGDGFTANDLNDLDVGPNELQNFPDLTTAITCGATTLVSGSLNSTANSLFTVEFFATPPAQFAGGGRGKIFLGATNLTTNATGNAAFAVPVAGSTVGDFITATATNPGGSTSEFSIPILAQGGLPPTITQGNNALQLMVASNSACPNAANQVALSAIDGDTVPAGLTWSISTIPTKGMVSFISGSIGQNVTICYKPHAGPAQPDSFVVRVTDSCGLNDQITINVVPQGVVNVGPPDNAAPVIACPGNISVVNGQPIDPSATGQPAVLDAIDPSPVVTFADTQAIRPCPELLRITRTWTATDASGNTATCQQLITILDLDNDGDGLRDCEDPTPIEPPVPILALSDDLCGMGLCASGTATAIPLTLVGLMAGKRRRRR